ncbi:uncharacterized protein Hap1MRO34_022297 [Clarias gariepinus]
MIVYENYLADPQQRDGDDLDEAMYVNYLPSERSRIERRSHSDQRCFPCPCGQRRVTCPTVGCQKSVATVCLAGLCMMLLVVIGFLSAINGHLRSGCLNQSAEVVLRYTTPQSHSESIFFANR